MDTIKNLISSGSNKEEQPAAANTPSGTPHPSGNLTGQGSHFGTATSGSGTTHMPGSWDEREFEATKGTGISSSISGANPSSSASAAPGSTSHSSAAPFSALSSTAPGSSATDPSSANYSSKSSSQPLSSGEYVGSSAPGVAGQSVAHSAQTTSAAPNTASTYASAPTPSSTYSQTPTASGEYAGSSAAGVAGQSVPHTAQTTSAAPNSGITSNVPSSAYPSGAPTSSHASGEYAGSSAPGVAGQSVPHSTSTTSAIPGAAAASTYAANDSRSASSGQYAGSAAPGVAGQSVPHSANTTSATPGPAAAAVYASNTSSSLPDRSVTTGTSSAQAAVGDTYTERSYNLSGNGASSTGSGSPHNTDTVNRIHQKIDSSPATGATGTTDFAQGSTSTAGAPYTSKVSQPYASDPISTAPLAAGAVSSSTTHKPHDSGVGHSASDASQIPSTTSRSTGPSSIGHPAAASGEHNPHGTDPHAYDRNFQDRAGGRDIVESSHDTQTGGHHGREAAAGAGAVGASGLAAHELSKRHEPAGVSQSSTMTPGATTGSDRGVGSVGTGNTNTTASTIPGSSNNGLGSSASTASQSRAVPYSVGGVAAAGTNSAYLTQPGGAGYGDQYSRLSDGTPSGISTKDAAHPNQGGLTSTQPGTSQPSHLGRDAAVAGGATGLAGAGTAGLAHQSRDQPSTMTSSSAGYGDQYKHLGGGTPSGISTRDAAHPSQGGLTSTDPSTAQSSHLGRDAAIAGGATGLAGAGAAGYGHHHHEKPSATTSSSTAYGDQYKHLGDGTPSGISTHDAAHPGQGGLKSTSTQPSSHHYARDAALAGGAGGATGVAAHELSQKGTSTDQSAAARGHDGLTYEEAFELGKQHGAADRAAGYQSQHGTGHSATTTTGPTSTNDPSYVGSTHTPASNNRSEALQSSATPLASSGATTAGHTTEHHPKNVAGAATGGALGAGAAGSQLPSQSSNAASQHPTDATSGASNTRGANVPSGYPFDSNKIEKAADEAHGREHHEEGHEKRSLLDKILHRDHPNKLHKEVDHAQAAKSSNEAYSDLKQGQAPSGSALKNAAEHEGSAQGVNLGK